VWIAGGVGGRTHDITLTRQSGLLESLESNKLILGDLGYLGEYQILTPHKRPKTSEQQTENNVINKKRVIVENVIKQFKDFHALSTRAVSIVPGTGVVPELCRHCAGMGLMSYRN
jgi:hypothetical protein